MKQIRKEVNYSFDKELLHGFWTWDDSPEPEEGWDINITVYQCFKVMKAIKFLNPLPWTNKSLYDWFWSAIIVARFRYNIEFNYYNDTTHVIHIKGDDLEHFKFRYWYHPQTGMGINNIISVLIHEARHAEGYGHTGLEDIGAFAAQYYFYLWIAKHSESNFFSQFHRNRAYEAAQSYLETYINP